MYIQKQLKDGFHQAGPIPVSTYHMGKVRTCFFPSLFLLIGVAHGTASRWWELLGTVGTQLFRLDL